MTRQRSVGAVLPHSESTLVLGLEAELCRPVRGRHLSPTEVRWADPLPTDHFGGGHYGCCVDSQGFHRPKHLFNVWTRTGTRCCFCWRRRGWEPL